MHFFDFTFLFPPLSSFLPFLILLHCFVSMAFLHFFSANTFLRFGAVSGQKLKKCLSVWRIPWGKRLARPVLPSSIVGRPMASEGVVDCKL